MVELTPKQKKFCEIYAMDPCGERAAIAAGYESKSARQQASRLLTNENIIIYIRELQETMSSARILTATETRMFWSDIIKDEKQKMSDRLQASLLLAKSGGLFRTSVEMNLHHEEKPSTLICLPAIPGEDPPRRGKNTWIYGEDEAELVHNYPNGRESK